LTAAWNNYYVPGTIGEALEILQRYDGRARVVGGGTDLLVEARRGLRRPFEAIVDASRIGGLGSIVEDGEYIVIGCGVTHTTIVNDERIIRSGTCLSESCGVIGGPQVRNTGTLAGNVAHALPAGDGTIGLLALGGEVEIASVAGTRWVPAKDTFEGPGRSAIDRYREILTRIRFNPTGADEGSAHHRVMRPQGLCLPIISMAARLQVNDGRIVAGSWLPASVWVRSVPCRGSRNLRPRCSLASRRRLPSSRKRLMSPSSTFRCAPASTAPPSNIARR
jgi:carbon-monoxide dehydrogenase medium subunit